MFRVLACAGLMVLVQTGCVDAPKTDTGSAPLYVFDGSTNAVMAWADVSTLHDTGTAGAAERTISTAKFGSSLTLGLGGMALDSYNQYLYLVSSNGTVVRISRIGSQSGAIVSSDVVSFILDDTGTDAEGGVFGQVAVNPVGSYLYVTECIAGGKSQVWAIPSTYMNDGATITKSTGAGTIIGNTTISGGTSDKACYGVAVSSSAVYGYFGSGGTVSVKGTDYTAPARLRKGTYMGFLTYSGIIIGQSDSANTLLGNYGCLAYDTGNDVLYIARMASADPLLAFAPGDFSPGLDVHPKTFGGPSDLRVIAHGGTKDWLVGAESPDNATGTNSLWIWKGPSVGDTHLSVSLPASVQILGLALDGSD